jgi:hypothetical protein
MRKTGTAVAQIDPSAQIKHIVVGRRSADKDRHHTQPL